MQGSETIVKRLILCNDKLAFIDIKGYLGLASELQSATGIAT
jgi:hypothetical protein